MRRPVETEAGQVEGILTRDDDVTVFRGIPFAAPPVGDLRWRPPAPPVPWEGVRKAHTFGAQCPQPPSAETADLPMSEDCLHLNLWAPSTGERHPVLVWIYGGGFRVGTGANSRFDGENLARKGLVVVTFNYRLGVFGFLATPELSVESDSGTSGNYGLLDCVAVLRWVQNNIAGFGGDPDRVTLAGQSAGAGTVNFLAMSPLAKGLFHRAVAQSHTRASGDPELRYLATSYRARTDAEAAGVEYAQRHGGRDPERLRALPWQKFVDGGLGPGSTATDDAVETGSDAKPPLFRPVVDGWAIPAGYARTYAAGAQNDVGYLTGNNLDEAGAIPVALIPGYRRGGAAFRPGAPPVHVTLTGLVTAARRKFGPLAEEFLRLYPAISDDEAAAAHNAAVRDNSRISTYLWALEWVKHADRPVFTYWWTHASPAQQPPRASHSSEIDYVFGNGVLANPRPEFTGADRAIAATVSGYWANFAATGDPNGPGLPHWPAFAPGSEAVMEIGDAFAPIPIAEPARFEFWQRFFRTQPAW